MDRSHLRRQRTDQDPAALQLLYADTELRNTGLFEVLDRPGVHPGREHDVDEEPAGRLHLPLVQDLRAIHPDPGAVVGLDRDPVRPARSVSRVGPANRKVVRVNAWSGGVEAAVPARLSLQSL